MGVNIDWSKVPREIDGKPTRWVAMDGDCERTWCAFVGEATKGKHVWLWAGIDAIRCLCSDTKLGWANGTPWTDTLTPTPWSIELPQKTKPFTKADLVPGKHVVKYRSGTLDVAYEYSYHLPEVTDRIGTTLLLPNHINPDMTCCVEGVVDPSKWDIVAVYEINEPPVWVRQEKSPQLVSIEAQLADLKAKHDEDSRKIEALEKLAEDLATVPA